MRAVLCPAQKCAFTLLALTSYCAAQSIITTYAGSRWTFPAEGQPAIQAPLGETAGIAADARGAIYFSDISVNRVFRIDLDGTIHTVAGNSTLGYSGDGGPATLAALNQVYGLVFDSAGNLYLYDGGNYVIRRVSPSGTISTFAGNGQRAYAGDGGLATAASFVSDHGRLAIDASNNLYVSDPDAHVVRRISPSGRIQTIAGNGLAGSSGDGGPATQARLQMPVGIAIDGAGQLYIADQGDARVRVVNASSGVISSFAGMSGSLGNTGDGGPALKARLASPRGVSVGPDGSVYISDSGGQRIRRVTPDGNISTFAGNGQAGLLGDGGVATQASLYLPVDSVYIPGTGLAVSDANNLRIRLVANGNLTTIAGNGNFRYTGDGGAAASATLPAPTGVVADAAGNVYLCDNFANRVRKIDAFGTISLVAGTNIAGFGGDGGPATSANLTDCEGIALDTSGNLYLADPGNKRIRSVRSDGTMRTVAGSGSAAYDGDGKPATQAGLNFPQGVAVDSSGNLYIADTGNHRIRLVSPSGTISTLAGTGTAGYSGDNGPATSAMLNGPVRVALDANGNVYFSDNGNNVVRKIAGGIITTVAGNGSYGYLGDGGPARQAELANPQGLAFDSGGALFIADADNQRVRIVKNGAISTYAGNGVAGLSGNGGAPAKAGLNEPYDISVDSSGNVYIAELTNARLRRVQPAPSSLLLSHNGFTFTAAVDAAQPGSGKLTILNGGAGTVAWSVKADTLSGGPNWLGVSPSQGTSTSQSASSPVTITLNPAGLASGVYYGKLTVTSPGVANSPRLATIVLNVLSAAQTAGPSVSPASIIFTGAPGGVNPSAQSLTITTVHASATSYTSAVTYDSAASGWLTVSASSTSVQANKPATLTLTANTQGLAPGTYTATVMLQFAAGAMRAVPVTLTLAPGASTSTMPKRARAADSPACTASKLMPVVTALSPGFVAPAGWPVILETKVLDDCGQPLTAGAVSASFSNGDPTLPLTSLSTGVWSATWNPRNVANLSVTFRAQSANGSLQGTTQVSGALTANNSPPIVAAGGIVNAASFASSVAAPGTLVTLFGSNLTNSTASANSFPLPLTLAGAQVFMGGVSVPLLYAGAGQINAIVPFEIAANAAQEVIVQSGNAYSVPETLGLAAVAPGVFTFDGSGKGAGIVTSLDANGASYVVTPANPAHPGGVLVVYCTGLGGVSSSLEAGQATPLLPLARTQDSISATVGGIPANVFFAGLVGGFSGLYQVNVIIPASAPTGSAVPLVLSGSGSAGPTVTVAIQ